MSDAPPNPPELLRRIRLVRRDIGNLLFHFTRSPDADYIEFETENWGTVTMLGTASSVLRKILSDAQLMGTSGWTYGENVVCFTEAPMQEFDSIFSLVEIAASKDQRPRYEPYGIALPKTYVYEQGGRPGIYDHPSALDNLPQELKYRFVPYDPINEIDFTWEREWRVKTDLLPLVPEKTLVVVPTASEAVDLVYEFSDERAEYDVEGTSGESSISGFFHRARWLAVSLDLFGFKG